MRRLRRSHRRNSRPTPAGNDQAQLNLLDSHDTPRFLTLARCDETAFRLGLLFMMTFPARRASTTATRSAWRAEADPDSSGSPWPDEDHAGGLAV